MAEDTKTTDSPDLKEEPTENPAPPKDLDETQSLLDEDDDDAPISLWSEFWLFLKEEKKWWLAPLIVVLLLLSAVIIFAEGSAIAPFIYTIF